MPEQAVILAGGASRRFGSDKASFPVDGRSMLERVMTTLRQAGCVVSVQGREPTADDDWQGLSDATPGQGPAAALHSALIHVNQPLLLVAVDLPWLSPEFCRWLLQQPMAAHGCVPTVHGQLEPCCARYTPAFAPILADSLAAGRRSLHAAIAASRMEFIEVPPAWHGDLYNCNTRDDLQRSTAQNSKESP